LTTGVFQTQWGEEEELSSFFNLGIGCGLMELYIQLTSLKKTQHPLYRRLDGSHRFSEQLQKICPHQDLIPKPSGPQKVTIPNKKYKTHKRLMLVMVWSWWQLETEADDDSNGNYTRHFCSIHLHHKWVL
jgi:hypothetical protein